MQKQIIPISFNQGMDTKTDKKQVQGKLLLLRNGFFKSLQEIRKRFGFDQLSAAVPLTSGNALATFKDELLSLTGSKVQSFSDEDDLWYLKGNKIAVSLETESVLKNSYSQSQVDSAINSGYQCFVYEDSRGGIRYSVKDTVSGILVVSDVSISSTGFKPKVKNLGSYFIIIYGDSSDGYLKYRTISVATPSTLSSATNIATDMSGPYPNYDICLLGSSVYVAYSRSASIALYSISSSLVLSSQYVVGAVAATSAICVFPDAVLNQIWVAYGDVSYNQKYFIVNAALNATILAATTIIATTLPVPLRMTGYASNGVGKYFYEYLSTYSNITRTADLTNAGVVSGVADFVLGAGLAGKPFVMDGTYYLLLAQGNIIGPDSSPFSQIGTQPTYFLVNSSGSVIGKLAPGVGGGVLSQDERALKNTLPEVDVAGSVVTYPYLIKYSVTADEGNLLSQKGLSSAAFTFSYPQVSSDPGNNLHISGALISMYDGSNVVEHGFNLYPEQVTLEALNGGGCLGAGTYGYQACFEWTDNQGQIHRSAPSALEDVAITTDSFTKTGTTSNGFPGVTIADLTGIYPGMTVTGAGIPANTYVKDVFGASGSIDLTQNATASATVTLTFTKSNSITEMSVFNNSTTALSTGVVLYMYKPAVLRDGYILIVDDFTLSQLKVGMGVDNAYTGTSYTITSISNNQVITNGSVSIGAMTSGLFAFYNSISTTITAGSPSFNIATADIPRIKVGDQVDADGVLRTVISIVGNTVTVGTNMGASGATSAAVYWNKSVYLYPGHQFTNSNFTGTVTVQNVNRLTNALILDKTSSATATSQTFLVSNTQSVIVKGYNLYLTEKTDPRIVIYRTEANGSILYRTSSLKNPLVNVKTEISWNYPDIRSDFSLIGNDLIYTTGGVIENIAPPAANIFELYKNRLVIVPSENPYSWQFSQQVVPGTPVEFNDSFVKNINQIGGKITALATLDEKLVIFKAGHIFYTVGDGPSSTGANDDFIEAQLITTDSGCINRKSIARMPLGIMYKSSKGIYLLDRSFQVSYIGKDIESYNDIEVTSADLIPTLNQVRYSLANGVVLVYDYLVNQWSVFDTISSVDSIIYQDQFTYVQSNGKVYQENPAVFTDDGSFIQLYLESSWLQLAGIQGFERVSKLLVIGEYESPHTLNVITRTDFKEDNNQLVQIPVTSDPGVYQYRVFTKYQKCESMKIIMYDTQDAPYGEGLRLSAMTLEVGIKQGLNKLPAAKSYG